MKWVWASKTRAILKDDDGNNLCHVFLSNKPNIWSIWIDKDGLGATPHDSFEATSQFDVEQKAIDYVEQQYRELLYRCSHVWMKLFEFKNGVRMVSIGSFD